MIDIDHFKLVNDGFGHAVGDLVIQEVAKRIGAAAREEDLVCRYGGEEFCIVVPGLGTAEVRTLAQTLRACIEQECSACVPEAKAMKITVSVGIHEIGRQSLSASALVDCAD
jgi:diguanylate cyclase (GGDEF)-like protein